MRKSELKPTEYQEFYSTYLNAIGNVELIEELQNGKEWMINFLQNLDPVKLSYAYSKDKWTIAEVIIHIIDTERVFQYRAFCFSKKDKTKLPGFDQDQYMAETDVANRDIKNILEEYVAVRESTLAIYNNLNSIQLQHTGIASDIQWSVAGLGFVISGHQKHHTTILQERYF